MSNSVDLNNFTEKLRGLDERLDRILDGEKLTLDPENADDVLLIQQIHNFYPEDYESVLDRSLDSPPAVYYITPDIVGTEREQERLEISTRVHPLHERLINSQEIFQRNSSKLNQIHNIVMAGGDLHFRDRRDYQKAFDRSENFFLHKRGDVVSLSQTIKLLCNVAEGRDKTERSIVIDNPNGRFTPVLRFLGIEGHEGIDALNDTFKRHKIKTLVGLVEMTGTSISKLNELAVDKHRKLPVLPPLFGGKLFFDTSSDEKIKDTNDTLAQNRSDIEIRHANLLSGHSEHDPEFTSSFGGNALAKGMTTLKDKLGSPHLDDDLLKQGVTRTSGCLMFADGGEYYEERELANTHALSSVKHIVHPDIEYPGPETKPWSQGLGNKPDTYSALNQAKTELEKATGRKVSARSVDNCVTVVIPLQQDDMDNPRYYAVKGVAKMDTVFDPRPAHHIHYTQRHFQRFEDCEQTLSELEDENDLRLVAGLAISKAMRGMMNAARVPKRPRDLKTEFDFTKDLEVVCPWQADELEQGSFRSEFAKAGMKFKILDAVESFDDVRRVMTKSKALFFPNVISGEKKNFWMSQILLPASILVGKQLRDPKVNGNPMVMFSGNDRRPAFEGILDHLKTSGMITQDLHFLYNRGTKMSSVMRYIVEQMQKHVQYDEYQHHKYQELPDTGELLVAYLLSATSAHKVDNDNAYKGAVNCVLNGQGVISGLGYSAPMGWHVMGALQAIREGFKGVIQGIQDPHAKKTEGMPLAEINKFMGEGHGVVAPDIFIRILQILEIEKLMKYPNLKKPVVTQANGIGGLQEIAGFLALKEAEVTGMDRAFLIIENTPRAVASGTTYCPHDALIDLLVRRDELHPENGLYVSEGPEETSSILADLTGTKAVYYDIERPSETLFPFAREKNDFYEWFMHPEERHQAPKRTIRQVYDEVQAGLQHMPEIVPG